MVPKAIVGALDGVFVDIRHLEAEAFQYAVKHVTGVNVSPTEQIRDFGNLTFNSKIALLNLSGAIWWNQLELVRAMYHERIFDIFTERIKPDNDIILVGEYIREHGFSLVCVTNKDYQVALFALDCCGVLPSIQYIITPDQIPMGKPAAFGYDVALHYCRTTPDETLVIESDVLGVEAARSVGCHVHRLPRGTKLTVPLVTTLIGDGDDEDSRNR